MSLRGNSKREGQGKGNAPPKTTDYMARQTWKITLQYFWKGKFKMGLERSPVCRGRWVGSP